MKKIVLAMVLGAVLLSGEGNRVFASAARPGEHKTCKECEQMATRTHSKEARVSSKKEKKKSPDAPSQGVTAAGKSP